MSRRRGLLLQQLRCYPTEELKKQERYTTHEELLKWTDVFFRQKCGAIRIKSKVCGDGEEIFTGDFADCCLDNQPI